MRSLRWTWAPILLACLFASPGAGAQVVVDPGATIVFATGDDFTTSVSTCDGANTCYAEALPGQQNMMYMFVHYVGGLNTSKHAAVTVYNRFLLSPAPAGSMGDRRLSAFVSGNVYYEGELHLGGTLGEAYAKATVTVRLRDLTDNVVVAEDVLLDRACSGGTWYQPDFCWDHPAGSRDFNLAATLIRGHTYQIDVVGRCTTYLQLVGGSTQCQFDGRNSIPYPGNGVHRGPIQVTVEMDLEEEIIKLREELEAFKKEYQSHTHGYRTGPGAGHNSVPAETGGPR